MTKIKLTKLDKYVMSSYMTIKDKHLFGTYNQWIDQELESEILFLIYKRYGGEHSEIFRKKLRFYCDTITPAIDKQPKGDKLYDNYIEK